MSAMFRYAALNRPIGFATVPKGFVSIEPRPLSGDGHDLARHGVVVYDRPLTEQEIYSFELPPVLDAPQIDALVEHAAQECGQYVEEMGVLLDGMPGEVGRCILQTVEMRYRNGFVLGDRDAFVARVLDRLGVSHAAA